MAASGRQSHLRLARAASTRTGVVFEINATGTVQVPRMGDSKPDQNLANHSVMLFLPRIAFQYNYLEHSRNDWPTLHLSLAVAANLQNVDFQLRLLRRLGCPGIVNCGIFPTVLLN